ncbi:MAG: calcium/sodium antiporter [Caenispirillum bisanense]|nr:calcium/sodium antiporter [Caenispirillum bisanense]MCA1973558.1 calcium/sodium antiporter [Caenispirillum sp.]
MLMSWISFAAGLVLLVVAAEALVRGAVAMAERLGISPLVIGLTVVAFGTSAPELVVCVQAALEGSGGLVYGNVIGSNIANIMLILAFAALIQPVHAEMKPFARESAVLIAATLAMVAFTWGDGVQRLEGAAMLAALAAYLLWSYFRERRSAAQARAAAAELEELSTLQHKPWWVIIGATLVGLAGVVAGARFLVVGATAIARDWGVPEEVIGLTMVAVGTSLPELATAVAAALKKHNDVALGNVVGSNVFNILGIMGVAALVKPSAAPAQVMQFDVWVMLGVTLLLVPFFLSGRQLSRAEGGLLLGGYAAYIAVLFIGVETVFA